MINFLQSLARGVDVNIQTHQDIIKQLLSLNAIAIKNNKYILQDKYRLGKLDVANNGIGYLATYGEKKYKNDLLIEQKDLKNAQKGDIVLAKRFFNSTQRQKAKVVLILKRQNNFIVIYTEQISKQIIGINVKTALHVNITASQKSLKALPNHTVLKINNETNQIQEVLGVLEDESVDEKISLAIFDKIEHFSDQSEQLAKSFGFEVDKTMYDNYTDLTHLPFCTIDPVSAKDFDDAIYYDANDRILYVAIADVSSYVSAFTSIDNEAKQRGFSIYFPHKSIPMLPRNLSENICSLKPHKDRLAFCFKLFLEPLTCKCVKEELFSCVINSKKRYTYEQIDEFIENTYKNEDEDDKLVFPWLKQLVSFTKKIRKIRLENSNEFENNEINMQIDEFFSLKSTHVQLETLSHKLIEECMLLANKAAAKRIEKGIFRNHLPPSYERIEELLVDLECIGIDVNFSNDLPFLIKSIQAKADEKNIRAEVDKLIIKAQKKAAYQSENQGHFGLGFSKYTHFTSPIRRYSDLVLHRLLKAQINNDEKQFNYQLQNIDTLCENLSELERQSDKVAWDYMDRKFARWASKNMDKNFQAIITDIGKTISAKLDDEIKGARIFILDENVQLLQKVLIKFSHVNIAQALIYAKVVKRF